MLVPAVVQKFVVQPNELKLETPYLQSYIAFTRKAYNLDAIQETSYPALGGSNARNDCEESRHNSKHSALGFASATADLSANASHTPLLPVLQRRRRIVTIWRMAITR